MFPSLDSFPLLALPLFTLSGELMEVSGISERLVRFMRMCFRKFPAASACITTISSAFFGAISGSAPATAAAIGGIMIEPMKDSGYEAADAAAINASSASLGIIIPPSIPMVVFATTASVSVGSLFMAGIVPGILLAVSFCVMHGIRYGHVEKRASVKLTFKEFVSTFFQAIFALGMPILILGGIYGGIFTPTEAAAVSCIYAIVVGCVIYQNLSFKQIWKSVCEISVRVSSMLTIVCCATAMAWFVSSSGCIESGAGRPEQQVRDTYGREPAPVRPRLHHRPDLYHTPYLPDNHPDNSGTGAQLGSCGRIHDNEHCRRHGHSAFRRYAVYLQSAGR